MKETKATIRSTAIFSEDGTHRVHLRREWDKNKPTALVIMINPADSTLIRTDLTTMCCLNNLEDLDYGAVEITNLYSQVTNKLTFRFSSDEELLHPDNDKHILKAADTAQVIILAWGTIGENNTRVKNRQHELLTNLKPYAHKIMSITDAEGNICIHPLCPKVRNGWDLQPFPYEDWMKKFNTSEKAASSPTSKASSKKNFRPISSEKHFDESATKENIATSMSPTSDDTVTSDSADSTPEMAEAI